MKHLKIYENWLLDKIKPAEYNVDDYVLIDVDKTDLPVSAICKIVDIENKLYNIKSGENKPTWWISKNIIKRKLTPEEIDAVKIRVDADKYNL